MLFLILQTCSPTLKHEAIYLKFIHWPDNNDLIVSAMRSWVNIVEKWEKVKCHKNKALEFHYIYIYF